MSKALIAATAFSSAVLGSMVTQGSVSVQRADVVEASKFVLRDATGRERWRVGLKDGKAAALSMEFLDAQGGVQIRVDVEESASTFRIMDRKGGVGAGMAVGADGESALGARSGPGRGVELRAGSEGSGLSVLDSEGKNAAAVQVSDRDGSAVIVSDPNNGSRCVMAATRGKGDGFYVVDRNKKKRAELFVSPDDQESGWRVLGPDGFEASRLSFAKMPPASRPTSQPSRLPEAGRARFFLGAAPGTPYAGAIADEHNASLKVFDGGRRKSVGIGTNEEGTMGLWHQDGQTTRLFLGVGGPGSRTPEPHVAAFWLCDPNGDSRMRIQCLRESLHCSLLDPAGVNRVDVDLSETKGNMLTVRDPSEKVIFKLPDDRK